MSSNFSCDNVLIQPNILISFPFLRGPGGGVALVGWKVYLKDSKKKTPPGISKGGECEDGREVMDQEDEDENG